MSADAPQGDLLSAALGGGKPSEERWEMDWNNSEEVIIQEQRAIAVYTNTKEGVVVRQERAWDEEDDVVIILSTRQAVETLIAALKRELGERG